MAKSYTFLARIPTNVFGVSSASYGLVGGSNTFTKSGATTITIGAGFNNYYSSGRVKLTDGTDTETVIISSVTGNVVTFSTSLQYTYATSGVCSAESYFGFAHNTDVAVDISEGYYYPNFTIDFDDLERSFVGLCEKGGSVQSDSGGSLSVVNTNKFYLFCEDNDIYLYNSPIDIFLKANSLAGTHTMYQLGRYIISDVGWTVDKYTISYNSAKNKRVANLTNKLNTTDYPQVDTDLIGTTIPVVFGRNYTENSYAKFVRSLSNKDKFGFYNSPSSALVNQFLSAPTDPIVVLYRSASDTADIGYYYFFPCVGAMPGVGILRYNFKVAGLGLFSIDGVPTVNQQVRASILVGQYIHVLEGKAAGAYRIIDDAWFDLVEYPNGDVLTLQLRDYFDGDEIVGNMTATEVDNSWIEIVSQDKQFIGETWKSQGYLDSIGNTTTDITSYAYNESSSVAITTTGIAETITTPVIKKDVTYIELPHVIFSNLDSDNNKIDSEFTYLSGENTVESLLEVPFETITLNNSDVTVLSTKWGLSTLYNVFPGLHSPVYGSWLLLDTNSDTRPENFLYSFSGILTIPDLTLPIFPETPSIILLDLKLPDFTPYSGYSDAYIALETATTLQVTGGSYTVGAAQGFDCALLYRRCIGASNREEFAPYKVWSGQSIFNANFKNTDDATNGSRDLFRDTTEDTRVPGTLTSYNSGYYNYNVTDQILTKDGTVKQTSFSLALRLLISRVLDIGDTFEAVVTAAITRLKLLLKASVSIEKQIYTKFAGRVFNDTWGGRRTSTNLIQNPIDILEHVCRLQNYSDLCEGIIAGRQYAPDALIDTAGFDSTADSRLVTLRSTNTAFSLVDYDKCTTDFLKTTLVKNWFLVNYTDLQGRETVKGLTRDSGSPSLTVTLAMIHDRTKVRIEEPNISNIYCEPTIKYTYSPAKGKFTEEISITNTSMSTYAAGYVKGVTSSSDALLLWSLARALFMKTKNVEQAPTDMTDLYTVGGADGYSIAVEYLYNILTWQFNKRVYFTLALETKITNSLDIGSRINIQLPHHTDNVLTEAMIVSISTPTKLPYICDVVAILYTEGADESVIQDNFTLGEEWQDTFTVFGDDNDINNI